MVLIFGYLALHNLSGRSTLPAVIMTVSGITLSVGVFGAFAFGYPAIAQRPGSVAVLRAIADGVLTPYSSVGALLYLAGTSWFAVVIWRSGALRRWAGVLLPVYYVLLLAPVFRLHPGLAYPLEFLGAGTLTAAGVLLAGRRERVDG